MLSFVKKKENIANASRFKERKEFIFLYNKLHAFSSAAERSGSEHYFTFKVGTYKQAEMKNMISKFFLNQNWIKQTDKTGTVAKNLADVFPG